MAAIGIVGYGHFGRALASLADGAGLSWLAFDADGSRVAGLSPSHVAASAAALAASAETIVLCVPVEATEGVLRGLRPRLGAGHLVLDVGSVKVWPARVMEEVLGAGVAWCATHPLFGPVSLSRGERPLRVVVCPNDRHAGAADRARSLFELLGCEVSEMSPDEHDRHMAETHALAFFVARAMLEMGVGEGSELLTPSFRAMAQTVETVRGDAGHLFELIQRGNPHAAAARRRFMGVLERIDREVG